MNKIIYSKADTKLSALTTLILLSLGVVASTQASANLISNGGFESGLTGWSCTGGDLCKVQTSYVHSGSSAVYGYDNSGYATLSQTFATQAGTSYDLDFWSESYYNDTANILRYSINGLSPITVTTTTNWLLTQSSFVATSASTTLSFLFETDPGTGTWVIDDVAVVSAVPVPAAAWLLGSGLLGLIGVARRKVA